MQIRKETHGENATRGVELVAMFYDNGVYEKDDKVVAHYGEFWGHPDAEISKGQTNLALVTERREVDGETRFNHSLAMYPGQLEAIKEAAGDNHAPLLDKDGNAVGTIYGFKADLMRAERNGKVIGFMPNTKTLAPSELSVADVDGKSIRTRIFEAMAEAKAAAEKTEKAEKAPAKAAKKAPAKKASAKQAEVEQAELV